MSLLRNIATGLRSLFRKAQVDRELDEELGAYVEMAVEEKMKDGMSRQDALRAVRLERGNLEVAKEVVRSGGWESIVDTLWRDVRFGIRTLLKSPGFTIVAVLTLALGIGANTAIFSLLDSVMLRLLPVQRPGELVMILRQVPGRAPDLNGGFTNALWEAIRDQQDIFSGVFAWSPPEQFDLATGGAVNNVNGLMVSGDYFNTLGINPAAGRLIAPGDDHRGCSPVAVLSYGYWQTHFGGAQAALGSFLSLDRQSFQVIGVSAPRFYGVDVGKTFDVAIPLCASALFDKRNLDSRSRWWLSIVGRVKPGIPSDQLKARLTVLSPGVMTAALPDWDPDDQRQFLSAKLTASPAGTGTSELRAAFGEPLNVLMVMVALVLLIACANIASLTLASSTARSKEIAIRKALGASRNRLVRQLLTESVLLSVLGAALGVLFAKWGTALLVRNLSTGRNPVFLDLSLDGNALGFTTAVAVLTGILVGLLPAFRSIRVPLMAAMKDRNAAGVDHRSRFLAAKWIVAGQLALSLVLLVSGGLLLRTFMKLLTLDLGFDRTNVLVVNAKPPWFAADTAKVPREEHEATYDEIARRLRVVPGVISVARSFTTPIGDDNWFQAIHTSAPNAPTGREATSYLNFVSPGYFATLRMPLVAGRDFDEHDSKNSALVAIVNQTAVRKFYAGANVLGQRFRRGDDPRQVEIVGIVKDSKYERVREVTPPTVFIPSAQAPEHAEAEEFEVRTSVLPSTLIAVVQRAIAEVNNDIPLEFSSLAEQVDDSLVQERLLATLSTFFGGLALLLAMIGLYGALSYLVTQRQREFGIRMALGAPQNSILGLVMKDVVAILAVGIAGGFCVSLATVGLLQKMLFGLAARDSVTLLASIGTLSAVAFFAGYLPARRAARVDPLVALRYE